MLLSNMHYMTALPEMKQLLVNVLLQLNYKNFNKIDKRKLKWQLINHTS